MCASARKSPLPTPLPEAESIDILALAKACRNGEIDLCVVLGPTASGKTRYAVNLAKAIGGAEIISADSRQVYIGMDIGTGKDLSEYGNIPHHLIDIVPAGERYTVYSFAEDFKKAWCDIRKRDAVPILCGGTGMYISAVTSGYDFKHKYALSSPRENRLQTNDNGNELPRNPFFIGTLVSREERVRRIDRRLDARLEEGMVEEVRGLLQSGIPAERLISYGLEYKFVTLFILGKLSYSEMREQLSTAIHQFAKRQMTWFRGMERSGVRIHWVEV